MASDQPENLHPSPTRSGKRAFYGMFRKTRRKARSNRALRGERGRRDVILEGEDDSACSTAANQIFVPQRTGGIVEPARSFYFSPLNSWGDRDKQIAASTGNENFGRFPQKNIEMNSIVCLVERMLRQIIICCIMFIAGTMASEGAPVAYHALELSLVAWGTCLFIMILSRLQNHQQQRRHKSLSASTPLINNVSGTSLGKHLTERLEILSTSSDTEHSRLRKKRSYHESREPPNLIRAVNPIFDAQKQHPHLENLYVICQRERVFPNALVDIDTEFFSGQMLLMFRTPDVDESNFSTNDPVVNYFRGKQRRFEFQWQLRLKKLVPGDVFMGVEVDEPIQMGMIQRALANAALAFTKKTNQGFSYRISDSAESGPSCLSFPVATSMDRFNATKLGEPVPLLGQEIAENPETMKQRKKAGEIEWSTDYVYTMALWSAYADWSDWKILNFPGIRPFSITSMVGVQPIKLTLYSQQNLDREVIIAMEVSHATLATLGSEAQRWIAENDVRGERLPVDANELSEIDSINENESHIYEEEMDEQFDGGNKCTEDLEVDEALDVDDPQTSCYILSGTSISLKDGTLNYVSSGGGYAVLQSTPPPLSFFVIEKIQPKTRKWACGATVAIRSGDVVRVKLVDATSNDVKYLTIHKGWWLRWSSARPKRNGLFCIRTGEPNGSPVVLGCPFSLASQRWSHYTIGACFESSAKYGGRMLGIYKTGKVTVSDDVGDAMRQYTDATLGDEEDGQTHDNELDVGDHLIEKSRDKRMMPLLLCAELCHSPALLTVQSPNLARNLFTGGNSPVQNPVATSSTPPAVQKHYDVDVPAWLEMMNRTQRRMQLVYAVRFKNVLTQAKERNMSDGITPNSRMFVKLRTGRDLAPILQPLLSSSSDQWQQRFDFELRDAESFTSSSVEFVSDEELDGDDNCGDVDDDGPSQFDIDRSNHVCQDNDYPAAVLRSSSYELDLSIISAANEQETTLTPTGKGISSMKRSKSTDDFSLRDIKQDDLHHQVGTQSALKKNKTVHTAVGRVAKTVKSSTVITGKHVIKHSKSLTIGTVKGTVSAGRAAGRVIPVSSVVYGYKEPRKHEPGGKLRKQDTRNEIDRAIKNIECTGKLSTSSLSGQLLAPDERCRKVSQILSDISNTPSSQWAISQLAVKNSTQDLSFLRGSSAAELGVKPLKQIDPVSDICFVIARCIYDGRWREELCVLYAKERHLAFYAPLAKKPSLAVSFEEITSARICEEHSTCCPLPGLYTLAIDTAWRCHYLTFHDVTGREHFLKILNNALFHAVYESNPRHSRKVAPEFESYRMSLETSLTGTVGKWCAVSTGKKSNHKKQRRVLNNRRMAFDLFPIIEKGDTQEKVASYVENLLRKALSFSPDTLNASEAQFIDFLDETSRLRTLPLQEIDLSSKEALCIFINLYHCLLQHSLLLAVDGLPNKRSVTQFKRCSCYEIGDDVFSLAELECCVIRGQTGRSSHIKPPFVDAPKTSRPYRMYGLSATDFRINFILNTGDMSYPCRVPVYKQQTMDEQMDSASSGFLMEQIKIDQRKRTVFLPKVCEVYALDFGMGDGLVCVSQCLMYLDEQSQLAIATLLENGMITVRFNQCQQHFHPSLIEATSCSTFAKRDLDEI